MIRIPASPMERLVAEWLAERARLIGSLIGLTDEQFNAETAPGQWTYRAVAKHVLMVEQDSLKAHGGRSGGAGAQHAPPRRPLPSRTRQALSGSQCSPARTARSQRHQEFTSA